jgi:hypothetical protein
MSVHGFRLVRGMSSKGGITFLECESGVFDETFQFLSQFITVRDLPRGPGLGG